MIPDLPGLEGALTTETLWSLTTLPAHLVIWGGGAVAAELAQAFRRLGSEVTLVTVLVTRDCRGVVCPDDGSPGADACLGAGGDESPPILGRIVERPSRPPRPCPAIPSTTSGSSGGLVEGHAPRDVTVPAARAPRFVQRGESLRFEFPART